jgi:hypothetical protein
MVAEIDIYHVLCRFYGVLQLQRRCLVKSPLEDSKLFVLGRRLKVQKIF